MTDASLSTCLFFPNKQEIIYYFGGNVGGTGEKNQNNRQN